MWFGCHVLHLRQRCLCGLLIPHHCGEDQKKRGELENINLAIAEQELVQEKFDEKQILYYLSNITKGDRSDIRYAQSLVDTFINSVYVYEDKVVIRYNFTGDGSKIAIEDIEKAMLEAEERENRQITQKAP